MIARKVRTRIDAAAKGRRREHRAKTLLEADGFVVTRAAGSLGAFDLVAIRRDAEVDRYLPVVRLVQIKSNRWPGSAEWDRMRDEALRFTGAFVRCEVWRFDDRRSEPKIRPVLNDEED